jgi:hypothetical protein
MIRTKKAMESYTTTSSDVRQVIITHANSQTARNLCLVDRRSRQLCQRNLTIQDKSRICLDDFGAARKCDQIPMFSQMQFLQLIPKNILVYHDDMYHNTYEFYPQGYKLPDEGFATALLKAKLMNTICAIVRADFLLAESTLELEIPPYLDVGLIDTIRKAYHMFTTHKSQWLNPFTILIELYNVSLTEHITIDVRYRKLKFTPESLLATGEFEMKDLSTTSKELFSEVVGQDKYLETIVDRADEVYRRGIPYRFTFTSGEESLNAFWLSRLIKIAFDQDYYYQCKLTVISRSSPDINILL